MDEENEKIIIIDIGTSQSKIGFGSDYKPYIVPTCLGYKKPKHGFYWNTSDYYKTINKNYSYPIKSGIITNFEEIETFYYNILKDELREMPFGNKLFITQPIFNPRDNMDKLAKIMFDSGISALYIGNQAVLSLLSKGILTGFSLESGDGITQLVPVYEGFTLKYAANKFSLSGRDLSEFMLLLLKEEDYRFSSPSFINMAKLIKENVCYVAENYEKEKQINEIITYEFPDGKSININEEKYICPEALFNPVIMGKEEKGIVEACYNSIQKCDDDLKSEMFGNIVLSGGNTKFKGFNNRFLLEMEKKINDKFKIKIHDVEDKISAVWEGASYISKLPFMESNWINKDEYEEYGSAIVHRKCF